MIWRSFVMTLIMLLIPLIRLMSVNLTFPWYVLLTPVLFLTLSISLMFLFLWLRQLFLCLLTFMLRPFLLQVFRWGCLMVGLMKKRPIRLRRPVWRRTRGFPRTVVLLKSLKPRVPVIGLIKPKTFVLLPRRARLSSPPRNLVRTNIMLPFQKRSRRLLSDRVIRVPTLMQILISGRLTVSLVLLLTRPFLLP